MSCVCVYNSDLPLCAETIIINTDLESGTYKSVITDKFGQKYERDIIVYGASFTIDLTDYPEGLINAYSTLIFEVYDGCDLQVISNCDNQYKQLIMTFVPNDTTETEIELCCN